MVANDDSSPIGRRSGAEQMIRRGVVTSTRVLVERSWRAAASIGATRLLPRTIAFGKTATICQPPSRDGPAVSFPPQAATRSRMPVSPLPTSQAPRDQNASPRAGPFQNLDDDVVVRRRDGDLKRRTWGILQRIRGSLLHHPNRHIRDDRRQSIRRASNRHLTTSSRHSPARRAVNETKPGHLTGDSLDTESRQAPHLLRGLLGETSRSSQYGDGPGWVAGAPLTSVRLDDHHAHTVRHDLVEAPAQSASVDPNRLANRLTLQPRALARN